MRQAAIGNRAFLGFCASRLSAPCISLINCHSFALRQARDRERRRRAAKSCSRGCRATSERLQRGVARQVRGCGRDIARQAKLQQGAMSCRGGGRGKGSGRGGRGWRAPPPAARPPTQAAGAPDGPPRRSTDDSLATRAHFMRTSHLVLPEVLHAAFEDGLVKITGHVLVQAGTRTLGMPHLAEHATVGARDAFDGEQ